MTKAEWIMVTTFKNAGATLRETWEYNADATDFVRGASLTLQYWKDHISCARSTSAFGPAVVPPRSETESEETDSCASDASNSTGGR